MDYFGIFEPVTLNIWTILGFHELNTIFTN